MDIDRIFKLPPAPHAVGSKRKLPDVPTDEALKRFRPDEHADPSSGGLAQTTSVNGESQEGFSDADLQEEDEEGRFFGGGLNEEQNQILDIFDRADADDPQDGPMTVPALRRLLGRFERAVAKNAEQRGKYPNDPAKFIESESALDSVLKEFLPLAQNPALYYPELIKHGAISLLSGLLSHENTDIAVDVIEVLQELTDDDIGSVDDVGAVEDGEFTDGDLASASRLALAQMVDELLANSIFELLVSNLGRLNEGEDADRQGVFQVLGIFDNLISFMPPLAEEIGAVTSFLGWLVKRIQKEGFDSNKQYAAEVLSVLLQNSRENVSKIVDEEGINILLLAVSDYRKRDPLDGEESEFMENVFDCLCSIVRLDNYKDSFVDAEGIELMIIMIKEKRRSRSCAIKVLDYAVQNEAGTSSAERFVEMLGLRTLFSAFMGRGVRGKKSTTQLSFEDDEHIISIIASLFSNLASDSAPRIRLVAKFIESDYEKLDRLLELRDLAKKRLAAVESQIMEEREIAGSAADDAQEDDWYLRRLDAGLSALQLCNFVAAWICVEDDGARTHVEQLLSRKEESLSDVIVVLRNMIVRINDSIVTEDADSTLLQRRSILESLVETLS